MDSPAAPGQWHLATTARRSGFAAVLRRAPAGAAAMPLDARAAALLGIDTGAPLRVAALDGAAS